jgi:hypothetical protein
MNMNTKKLNETILAWAHETDHRIKSYETYAIHSQEYLAQTNVELRIIDEITGQLFALDIWIPHGRRTPHYFYGPDGEGGSGDGEDFSLPSFDDEESLRKSLTNVYMRFMTAHGMMRFPMDAEPAAVRDCLLLWATKWTGLRRKKAFRTRELPPGAYGLRHGGIQLNPVGRNHSGLVIRINCNHSLPQACVWGKSGPEHYPTLPAFFTEEEFLGVLENSANYIIAKNRSAQSNKNEKP